MKQTNTQQDRTAAACGFDSYVDMFVELDYFTNGYGVLAMMSQKYGLRSAFIMLNA